MTFKELKLNNQLWQALDESELVNPTPIQQKVFPLAMAGKDLLGIAQTGTGKTIAYLLPLLKLWNFSNHRHATALIIVPTRELVAQVVEEAQMLAKHTNIIIRGVYGGTNLKTQAYEVAEGVDIIVGTPGRLYDLALHGTLQFKYIKRLVIDEVDEMLNLGFRTQIENIFELMQEKKQNLLFSATMTEDIESIIEEHFIDPIKVEAAPAGTPLEKIIQYCYKVPNFNTKINLLVHLLKTDEHMNKVLIFVSSKGLADYVFEKINQVFEDQIGIIHSNKDQNFRFNAVKKFKDRTTRVLIATDIMARGIDVEDVSHVINLDLPDTTEKYIHRIGRTGRADKSGTAISMVSDFESEIFKDLEDYLQAKINISPTPDEVEISDILISEEEPEIKMKNVLVKQTNQVSLGAFHDKKTKNKKINIKISYKDKMHQKYGKPKTRGMKKK